MHVLLSPLERFSAFDRTDRPVLDRVSTPRALACEQVRASTFATRVPEDASEWNTHVGAAPKGERYRDESQTSCVMDAAWPRPALSGTDVDRRRPRKHQTTCLNRSALRHRAPQNNLYYRPLPVVVPRVSWSPRPHSGWSATVIVLRIVFVLCGLMLSTINDRQSRLDTLSWFDCS